MINKVVTGEKTRILFPSSSGGHLDEILQLKKLFANYECLIVTENVPLNRVILKNKNYILIKPNGKNRDFVFWKNLFLNCFSALKIILKFKPDLIVTTGSHTCVPFCYIGKLLNIKVIFILSYCRVNSRAKSADLIYPITDLFFVQWEQMKKLYQKGVYAGPLF